MAIYYHQFFNIDIDIAARWKTNIDIGNINILLQYIDLYPWIRATVEESIRGHSERVSGNESEERVSGNLECKVAANAGFFDMKTGECMGKVQKYALDYS